MRQIVNPLKPRAAVVPISRHSVFEAGTSILTAAIGWGSAAILPNTVKAAELPSSDPSRRQRAAFEIRQSAAESYRYAPRPVHMSNGDEARYADKRASFAKTLPHNDAGEVDGDAFVAFITALTSGKADDFEKIPCDRIAETELNDPQAAYAFELVGLDSAATVLDPAPMFASAAMAGDMAEVYWLSLTRDIPFREYERNPLLGAAVSDLNGFTEPLRSGNGGKLNSATIFRGEMRGDLIGPYLSQFLLLDIPHGIKAIEQRYTVPTRGQSFLTNYAEWLACQRGARPHSSTALDAMPRFICSARELSEYVHRDFSFQSYINAALIMLAMGKDALSPTNPYRQSRLQIGDITLAAKTFCRCWHRRHSLDKREPIFISGRFIVACGRNALPVALRYMIPVNDDIICITISSIARLSPKFILSLVQGCCL